jgi:hypothetical protein
MRVLECVWSAMEFVRNNEAAGGSGSGCACPPAACGFEFDLCGFDDDECLLLRRLYQRP